MSKEVMQQALDALERQIKAVEGMPIAHRLNGNSVFAIPESAWIGLRSCVYALREALAEHPKTRPVESDYTSQVAYTRALEAYCDGLAEQEPSAWQKIECPICGDMAIATDIPAAQRKPLSDEEMAKAWAVADGEHNASASVKRRITRAIEAKLREKNT